MLTDRRDDRMLRPGHFDEAASSLILPFFASLADALLRHHSFIMMQFADLATWRALAPCRFLAIFLHSIQSLL
jgi:hypothetical protein